MSKFLEGSFTRDTNVGKKKIRRNGQVVASTIGMINEEHDEALSVLMTNAASLYKQLSKLCMAFEITNAKALSQQPNPTLEKAKALLQSIPNPNVD